MKLLSKIFAFAIFIQCAPTVFAAKDDLTSHSIKELEKILIDFSQKFLKEPLDRRSQASSDDSYWNADWTAETNSNNLLLPNGHDLPPDLAAQFNDSGSSSYSSSSSRPTHGANFPAAAIGGSFFTPPTIMLSAIIASAVC